MLPRTTVFIDGENLLARFEAMLATGLEITSGTKYSPGRFVWHPNLSSIILRSVSRICYYTAFVASDDGIFELRKEIAEIEYGRKEAQDKVQASVVPFVFKKEKQKSKSKSVDINLTTDILRGAYTNGYERAFLISGDGDYVPVVQDVMRLGKQVYIGALSSGLNRELPVVGDHFYNLDSQFFMNPPQPA